MTFPYSIRRALKDRNGSQSKKTAGRCIVAGIDCRMFGQAGFGEMDEIRIGGMGK